MEELDKTEAQAPKPKKERAPKKPKCFTKNLYIPGYRLVAVGDEVTSEAKKAWKEWTETPIADFLT